MKLNDALWQNPQAFNSHQRVILKGIIGKIKQSIQELTLPNPKPRPSAKDDAVTLLKASIGCRPPTVTTYMGVKIEEFNREELLLLADELVTQNKRKEL